MYSYLKGEIIKAAHGILVLECNGIGYELSVSDHTINALNKNEYAKVFTYLQVREDGMTLFGFSDEEEKAIFLKLISVTGIGPKAAMGILSGITLPALVAAIITKDIKALSKVKGVGKKTAERLVLELKESLEKEFRAEDTEMEDIVEETGDEGDAVLALRTLGIGRQEAVKAVKKAVPMSKSIQELISNALKYL